MMCSFQYFIVLLIFIKATVFGSFLNIEELNSIHYSIDIVSNPVLKTQEWNSDIVKITNKHGQEYVCTLPEIHISENESKKEEDLLDQLVDISELLKPMEAAPCLIKKKDWWSYEFCYGSVIKQYHLEDNKVVGTILILGKYESEYNWKNNSKAKNKLQKFHTQSYVNGTRCDITGEPRRAEIRFQCEEGVGDYIQQVDEPESCRYVIIIATTRVCHHPYLRQSLNRMPHSINCAPALTQDEYQRYQQIQEAKQIELEEPVGDETSSGSGLGKQSSLVNAVGENETDEESKVSIRLVTIPISKKGKGPKDSIISRESSILPEQADIDELLANADGDAGSSTGSLKDAFNFKDMTEGENLETRDSERFGNAQHYLSEDEVLEKEINQIMNDFDRDAQEQEQESEDEIRGMESDSKQFDAFRKRMEKLMGKWMKLQNEDHIQELLDKIKSNLDENVQQLQETANKITEKSLSTYLSDLAEIADKYKKKLPSPKAEDLNSEEEKVLLEALNSLTDILSEAELEMIEAIRKKKKLDHLEKFLDSHLKQTEENMQMLEEGVGRAPTAGVGDTDGEDAQAGNRGSHLKSPDTFGLKTKRFEDPIDTVVRDENEDGEKTEEKDQDDGETRQLKILNEKNIGGERKTKLEQSIKERLQKSGLDNIGQKIEVKIFTPTYLDDDEKDSLSSLSQEETEAFHNMIVNILSASAEELKEKERHMNLESSYNFRIEDPADASGIDEVPAFRPTSDTGDTISENSDDDSKYSGPHDTKIVLSSSDDSNDDDIKNGNNNNNNNNNDYVIND